MRGAHRRATDGRAFDDVYDAFKHPRRERPTLADPRRARRARVRRRACATGRSRCSTRSISTRATHCSPTGSCTAWSCSTSTSTTRRCSRPSSSWTTSRTPTPTVAAATAPVAGHRVRPRARRARSPAGTFVIGTDADPWAYDNERPAHTRDARAVPDRHDAGHQPRVRRVRRRRRLRRSRALERTRAGPGATKPTSSHRSSGAATATARGCGAASARTEAAPARRARAARLLVRGRRVRALVGRAAPDRGRVGGRRPRLVARRTPTCGDAGPHRFAPAPVGSRARRRQRRGACTRCSATCGSGPRPTSSPTRASESFPYREYSEVFFGPEYKVLRGGSWATHPSAVRTDVPQLGLPDPPPDLRRLPLRARRVTADVPPPRVPRPARRARIDLLFDAPHSLAHQARAPAAPDLGRHQPRRLGRRLVPATATHGTRPVPHGHADLGPTPPFADRAPTLAQRRVPRAPRGSRRRAPTIVDDRQRAVRRPAAGRSRSTASCTASATASATSCGRGRARTGSRRHRGRRRLRGAVRAGARPPRRRRHARRARSASVVARRARDHDRAASTCC